MKTITDINGHTYNVSSATIVVTATDKFLSGWGRAEGKTHKQVVICSDWSQADRVERNLRKEGRGMKYVSTRRGVPNYPASRYTFSIRHADDCPLWNE
jgi:hypothetical protein